MVAQLQQKRDGKLRDRRRAVGRDICDQNALFLCIGAVDNVVARGEHRHKFQIRTCVERGAADRRLVDDGDLSLTDALGNDGCICVGGAVVDGDLSEGAQRVPAQVAGIFRVSVQNNDLHLASSRKNSFLPSALYQTGGSHVNAQ